MSVWLTHDYIDPKTFQKLTLRLSPEFGLKANLVHRLCAAMDHLLLECANHESEPSFMVIGSFIPAAMDALDAEARIRTVAEALGELSEPMLHGIQFHIPPSTLREEFGERGWIMIWEEKPARRELAEITAVLRQPFLPPLLILQSQKLDVWRVTLFPEHLLDDWILHS